VVTLTEWEPVKDEDLEDEKEEAVDIEGEETQEEVIEEADKAKMLVLRWALSSQRSEKEEQNKNMFHS